MGICAEPHYKARVNIYVQQISLPQFSFPFIAPLDATLILISLIADSYLRIIIEVIV